VTGGSCPSGRANASRCAAVLAVAAALLALGGCDARHDPATSRAAQTPAPTPPRLAHAPDSPESLSVAEFKTFALNALLIPLLDDAVPPRWIDPQLTAHPPVASSCDSAEVEIDGHPLVANEAVPPRAFTVHWKLGRCALLNGASWLSGDVELLVFHDGDSYSAVVQPVGLHIVSSNGGTEVLTQRFATATPLSPWSPP